MGNAVDETNLTETATTLDGVRRTPQHSERFPYGFEGDG